MPRSKPPKYFFQRGEDLSRALSSTPGEFPVKWIIDAGASPMIKPINRELAAALVKTGDFEGKCNHRRVISIRELPEAKPVPNPEYWEERSVLRWAKPVDKETVKVWERIFANQAANPRSV